jgi:hypothetical protein
MRHTNKLFKEEAIASQAMQEKLNNAPLDANHQSETIES